MRIGISSQHYGETEQGSMGTVSLLIFYILFGCVGGFALYCSKLSLKKALGHLTEGQRFSGFTFYVLYIAASIISTVMVAVMLSEIVLLITGLYLSPTIYAVVTGCIVVLTIIVAVSKAHKTVMQTLKK